jgi:hypothetical protein
MSISKAVILGICIISGGAIGVRAGTGVAAKDAVAEEVVSATADTSVASPSDSTRSETFSSLDGHWRTAETKNEKEQRLKAIDEVTDDLGRLKRGKARSRLEELTSPPPNLIIEVADSTVAITSGDHRLELELGGPPVKIEGSEGTSQISAKMEGELLVVLSQGDTGDLTVAYKADKKSLSREVTMTGEKLAGPLTYVTTYTRKETKP